jgi:hypothetical protein
MVRDLRQGVETINRSEYLTALLGQQGLGRAANGFAVIDDENLEAV